MCTASLLLQPYFGNLTFSQLCAQLRTCFVSHIAEQGLNCQNKAASNCGTVSRDIQHYLYVKRISAVQNDQTRHGAEEESITA